MGRLGNVKVRKLGEIEVGRVGEDGGRMRWEGWGGWGD